MGWWGSWVSLQKLCQLVIKHMKNRSQPQNVSIVLETSSGDMLRAIGYSMIWKFPQWNLNIFHCQPGLKSIIWPIFWMRKFIYGLVDHPEIAKQQIGLSFSVSLNCSCYQIVRCYQNSTCGLLTLYFLIHWQPSVRVVSLCLFHTWILI